MKKINIIALIFTISILPLFVIITDTFAKKLPDLEIKSVSGFPSTPYPGSTFSIDTTIKNTGNRSAGKSEIRYYLSSDAVKSSDDTLLRDGLQVPKLKKKKMYNGSTSITIPDSIPLREYYVIACADDTNSVRESNENNNCVVLSDTINPQATMTCKPPQETYQVVTIYFAGTGLTEEWWDPSKAVGTYGYGFWTPELVAMLHKWQNTSATHKKKFIDGIGTGCAQGSFDFIGHFLDLLNQGFPSWGACRNWEMSMQEAEDFLRADVLDISTEKVILNLVGLSRGGVLTMRFANRIYRIDDIRDRIERINIIAFEPAAGDTTLPPSEFILNPLVSRYVGMYATDERAAAFSPSIPGFESSETEVWMFRVPGAHETLVGNIQTDGHHTNYNVFPCTPVWYPFAPECFDDELLKVSWVTTFVAEKLLGSFQWGNVEFNMDKLNIWQSGLSDENSEDIFIGKVDDLWNYNYMRMRQNTVNPIIGFESCRYDPDPPTLTYAYYSFLDWFVFGGYNYDRCTDWFIAGDPPVYSRQLLESGPFMPIEPLDNAQAALYRVHELGFPDEDGDGITDSLDNCPTIVNPDQNDFDCDLIGDVCDNDSDGDGVDNKDDLCEFTALGEIVDMQGCSIDQLCPCEGPMETAENWKNHGQYVSCIAHSTKSFVWTGLITEAERDIIVPTAAHSTCGRKK